MAHGCNKLDRRHWKENDPVVLGSFSQNELERKGKIPEKEEIASVQSVLWGNVKRRVPIANENSLSRVLYTMQQKGCHNKRVYTAKKKDGWTQE